MDKPLATATIGRTHGLEGFLRIHPFSGEVDHLEKLQKGVVRLRDGRQVAVTVSATRHHADSFLMRFSGYDSKEKAAALSGAVLLIDRSDAPVLEEGEYYIADLYGLKLTAGDVTIGTITAVADGAQADYLVIKKDDGKEVLIPNMAPFVSKPDFTKGCVELLMPELAGDT